MGPQRPHPQRQPAFERFDGARMDDARTVVAQFQRLGMVDEWHGLGIWVALGIGIHHARNVFPNGDLFGAVATASAALGPFSAEGRRCAIFVPTNESLRRQFDGRRRSTKLRAGTVLPNARWILSFGQTCGPWVEMVCQRPTKQPIHRWLAAMRGPIVLANSPAATRASRPRPCPGPHPPLWIHRPHASTTPSVPPSGLTPLEEGQGLGHLHMGRHTRVPQIPSLRRISLPHGLEGVGGLAHRRDHNHRRPLGIQVLNQQRANASDGVGVADRGSSKPCGWNNSLCWDLGPGGELFSGQPAVQPIGGHPGPELFIKPDGRCVPFQHLPFQRFACCSLAQATRRQTTPCTPRPRQDSVTTRSSRCHVLPSQVL